MNKVLLFIHTFNHSFIKTRGLDIVKQGLFHFCLNFVILIQVNFQTGMNIHPDIE